eukprot:1021055-Prorocentrum_minimum.AAC.1
MNCRHLRPSLFPSPRLPTHAVDLPLPRNRLTAPSRACSGPIAALPRAQPGQVPAARVAPRHGGGHHGRLPIRIGSPSGHGEAIGHRQLKAAATGVRPAGDAGADVHQTGA